MDYKKKYLKYKNKYLNLLKLKGGEHEIFEIMKNMDDLEKEDKVIKIINKLSDLNIKDSNGVPLLTWVMMSFKTDSAIKIAKILIEKGANINIIDDTLERTPLMYFLLSIREESFHKESFNYNSNEWKFVSYLIKKGANINYMNALNESALYFCADNKLYNIMDLLFSYKVEIKSEYHDGCPLEIILRNGGLQKIRFPNKFPYEEEIAEKLIRRGALFKENFDDNQIVIHNALVYKLSRLLIFLIQENYDSSVSGLLYDSIFAFAEENKNTALITILKRKIYFGQVNVKFGIKEFKIRANDMFTVSELKHNISDSDNIHLVIQHNGKKLQMENERTLSDYGFKNYKELNIEVLPKIKTGN